MNNKSEQWLLNGDCSKCRRENYCSKPCTLYKRKSKAIMHRIVKNAINEATGGAYSKILN